MASTDCIVFLSHSSIISDLSFSDNFQLTFDFLILSVRLNKQSATDTEILKLSVKPTMGIFTNPSAYFTAVSEIPFNSVPNNNAVFSVMASS
jgi:hypothetical protein